MADAPVAERRRVGSVTCAGCALLCDDVTLEKSGQDVQLRPRCDLGAEWFQARAWPPADAPAATVDGRPADVETALHRAAELLRDARRPLVHGFDAATVEDTRAAVALADRLGALVATDRLDSEWPGAPAVPLRGSSTASLGEIRDRARIVVVWRADPERTHPRLLDRLGLRTGSSSLPRAERTLVVVDDRDTATAERADLRLSWPPERDLEALTHLHTLQRGVAPSAGDLSDVLQGLLDRLHAVPHAAFVHGAGLTAGRGGQRRALALHELVRALCDERHVVTLGLPAAAGITAARDVLTWQTGYPGTADLVSGHPTLVDVPWPLASGEGVDVALRVEGVAAQLPAAVSEIALGSLPAPGAQVSIRTAAAGVAASGTAHRLDGIPLALQAPWPSDAPTAAAVLSRLLDRVAAAG